MDISNLADRRPGSLGQTGMLHRFRSWFGKPPAPHTASRAPASFTDDLSSLSIETSRSSRTLLLRFHAGTPAPGGRALDRHGFLRNRLRSYPDRQLREHEDGLFLLGGPPRALGFAWKQITRSLASKPLELEIRGHGSGTEGALLPWARSLASHWGIEVEPGSLDEMDAFLLQTRSRSVIYLKRNLRPGHQALCVCHELAHHALGHRPNSSYGLDPRWLAPEELVAFERQEAVADALASLWLHLFAGLTDIGHELARPSECCRTRCTSLARGPSRF
ncbi:MAG TPA: ImmA/IrrE family metallo-endopeptidase [Thermoanaerobaculia bacterium]|nr:ImmA/IrrE family metallo-endopeptidase [Thermoanaerobaculia bacterium]